jgi:hypothetical protein
VSIRLYTDVHVPFAITGELELRGVNVLTSQTDKTTELDDSHLLARATSVGRVLFTQDDDLLSVASDLQQKGTLFAGLIYAHQLRIGIGQCVADIELIAKATDPEDWVNRVEFLPL